jgi:hypothetical protein
MLYERGWAPVVIKAGSKEGLTSDWTSPGPQFSVNIWAG